MDQPGTYRIRVCGYLSEEWARARWEGVTVTTETLETGTRSVFQGLLRDQAELLGVINALYNTGFVVVSLERLEPAGATACGPAS
jgi:hypothetical protein